MLDVLTIVLLALGVLFFIGVAVGILRMPDFYTRSHAAAKGDTLSSFLMLLAFALYNLHHFTLAALLVSLKLLIITLFISITSPTASHALIDAGYESGLEPWTPEADQPPNGGTAHE